MRRSSPHPRLRYFAFKTLLLEFLNTEGGIHFWDKVEQSLPWILSNCLTREFSCGLKLFRETIFQLTLSKVSCSLRLPLPSCNSTLSFEILDFPSPPTLVEHKLIESVVNWDPLMISVIRISSVLFISIRNKLYVALAGKLSLNHYDFAVL